MRKKECKNGTEGLGTPVPNSFYVPVEKEAPPKKTPQRKARHWLHRAAVEVAVNPAREEHYFILDTKYSKSRRGFELDREIKKARKVSAGQQSLLEAKPFVWWEDGLHKKEIKACFHEYLVDIADKQILLRSKVKQEPIVKDYAVRFSEKRLGKTRWQLGGIKIEFGTHLVLTVDPKRYQNIVACTKGLRREWNDLRRWLQRYFCVKTFSYIEVLEFGKEHDLPHLHVLLGRIFFEKADLNALYEHRGEQRIRVTRIRD